MDLVSSYIITYRIYVLKHPVTNVVFYVGKTMKELKERLSGHLSSLNSNGNNKAKNEYIKAILDSGNKPVIEEVEVINGTCYLHNIFASYREFHWMTHYKNQGVSLLNHMGIKTDAICSEYESYVREIKEQKGSYHYYLCGKTQYGIKAYDAEKMEDDGFSFEADDEDEEVVHDEPIRELTYHPIYDDDNPDYIRASLEEI